MMLWWTALLLGMRGFLALLWFFLKPVLGWALIVIGLVGMPLPVVNGLIFLVIGLAMVGPRNIVVRWTRVQIKLLLRRWAALPTPLIGPLGRLADRAARQLSRSSRRLSWWWGERRSALTARRPTETNPHR